MDDPEMEHIFHVYHSPPPIPPEPKGWIGPWLIKRRCRRHYGGHFWHPVDAMIAWGCCHCGARRDGSPKDGT